MRGVSIRRAVAEDLAAIHELAQQLVLGEERAGADERGFLVSGYTLAEYRAFLEQGDWLFVAETADQQVAGFLLAYPSERIAGAEGVNGLLRANLVDPFVLIKQICVAPSAAGRGIATALYQRLFDVAPERGFAAAIVTEPWNAVSIGFHERRGFQRLCDILPPADPDGVVRPRGVWYRNRDGRSRELPATRMHMPDREADVTHLLEKQHAALALYTHEDNLNWTKLGMLITFMMALFAVFSFLWQQPASVPNLAISGMTIAFGLLINAVFATKIRSGLRYMDAHKRSLREYENKLRQLSPLLGGIIDGQDAEVAGKSATIRLMRWIPWLSYAIWVICSGILVAKLAGTI